MELEVLFDDQYKVAGVVERGKCLPSVFLGCLQKTYEASRDGLITVLEEVSENGFDNITDSISHIVDAKEKIYEFIKGDLRLFYFKGNGDILVVVTGGSIKKGRKVDEKMVQKAITIKKNYTRALKDGGLVIKEI